MGEPRRRDPGFFRSITEWWSGPGRLEKVHIAHNGVLSRRSDLILKSASAQRQIDAFVALDKEREKRARRRD